MNNKCAMPGCRDTHTPEQQYCLACEKQLQADYAETIRRVRKSADIDAFIFGALGCIMLVSMTLVMAGVIAKLG